MLVVAGYIGDYRVAHVFLGDNIDLCIGQVVGGGENLDRILRRTVVRRLRGSRGLRGPLYLHGRKDLP